MNFLFNVSLEELELFLLLFFVFHHHRHDLIICVRWKTLQCCVQNSIILFVLIFYMQVYDVSMIKSPTTVPSLPLEGGCCVCVRVYTTRVHLFVQVQVRTHEHAQTHKRKHTHTLH